MEALLKLQEKITQWKENHEALKMQNSDLKSQLAGVASAHTEQEKLVVDLRKDLEQCTALEREVSDLKKELLEKDAEIEKIITQVESLLA
jgi:SMC interacting uncharacterized protein involved in chromosome segregation